MRYRNVVVTLIAVLLGSMAFSPAEAQYESNYQRLAHLTAPSDVFYFFDGGRKTAASYQSSHIMRVCLGDGPSAVPLRIIHDEKTTIVAKNDCVRVEAKELALEPAEPLKSNVVLRAEVETLN